MAPWKSSVQKCVTSCFGWKNELNWIIFKIMAWSYQNLVERVFLSSKFEFIKTFYVWRYSDVKMTRLLSRYLFVNKRKELQLKRRISPQLHWNDHKRLPKKSEHEKTIQLKYGGRDGVIQVNGRPYCHYGPLANTMNRGIQIHHG